MKAARTASAVLRFKRVTAIRNEDLGARQDLLFQDKDILRSKREISSFFLAVANLWIHNHDSLTTLESFLKSIFRTSALLAALIAGGAQAQIYVEGSLLPTKLTSEDPVATYKPTVLTGIVGYGLHPNLAIEGVLGTGMKKGSSGGWDVKVKSTYGFYFKPRYQISDKVEVFARVGYLKNKFEGSDADGPVIETPGSSVWGLGASYAIDKNLYLTVGYNQLYKNKGDGVNTTGLNFGIGYKF